MILRGEGTISFLSWLGAVISWRHRAVVRQPAKHATVSLLPVLMLRSVAVSWVVEQVYTLQC